jgi:tetratricopeptide (TPR) repeat protein
MRVAAAGEPALAGRRLVSLIADCEGDPEARNELASGLYHLRRHAEAADMLTRSQATDCASLSGLAANLVALGDLAGARATFDRLLSLHPHDGAAWYNRSTLKRWSKDDNNLAFLERALASADGETAIPILFGLAKELEDLGRHEESFAHLSRGAALRRSRMAYDVGVDVSAMADIAESFQDLGAPTSMTTGPSQGETVPIFVLGLPRSGTTLVDRILSAHSQVDSLGEAPDLALSIMETTPRAPGRKAFIQAAARTDPAKIAARFMSRLAGYETSARHVIDKTPVNFLYIGLIARALPQARIIHVRRNPVDVGYALFKTLFQTGSPYSYDLTDIGRYILAYQRLMAHWRTLLGERLIEIDYEAIVLDFDPQARRLVAACGLDWENASRDFHNNARPSSTASAAQVRRPLYSDSVGLSARYAEQLTPLTTIIRENSHEIRA